MKKELNSREDIRFLIQTFYGKVRNDEMLGPVFNAVVKDWTEHLERITNFWATSLLLSGTYRGNPAQVHKEVDRQVNNRISMEHFGRWLQLWFSTIDEHFIGKNADLAKNRARNMATHMFLRIFESREKP